MIPKPGIMNLYSYLPNYLIAVFTFAGTYCLIFAYQKQYEIEKTISKGIQTIGTVIDFRVSDSDTNTAAAVVEFTTKNGTEKHISSTYHRLGFYKIGQKVPIWYYHQKSIRQSALADDKPGNLPKRLLILGIVLCLLSYPEIIRRILTRL